MENGNIMDNNQIQSLLKHIHFDSTLLLDLDNTVIESRCSLGSDQWFVALCTQALRTIPDKKEAIQLSLVLYYEIQKRVKVQAVEELTVKLIKTFQDIGIPVLAITARGEPLQDSTVRQLKDNGIDFSKNAYQPDSSEEPLILDVPSDGKALYKDGIIFCSGGNKGQCLDAYFRASFMIPQRVFMVDDKSKHLAHVQETLKKYDIPFLGLRYGYLDDKVSQFNMAEANSELAVLQSQLADDIRIVLQRLGVNLTSVIKSESVFSAFYKQLEAHDKPKVSNNDNKSVLKAIQRSYSTASFFEDHRITSLGITDKPHRNFLL